MSTAVPWDTTFQHHFPGQWSFNKLQTLLASLGNSGSWMVNMKEDRKATDVGVYKNVTWKLQILSSYGIYHCVDSAKIIPVVHAFFHCHLKKKNTLFHWQDFTLNSIQRLTQFSKKNRHYNIFLVTDYFHRKYLFLYSGIVQPHFDWNGAKGWQVLSAMIIMMLLCCEWYLEQVSKGEMIILSTFVYVVKKKGNNLLKTKKPYKYTVYKNAGKQWYAEKHCWKKICYMHKWNSVHNSSCPSPCFSIKCMKLFPFYGTQ